MRYRLVKTGAERFDALHAYGLGILLAAVSDGAVSLCDEGLTYALTPAGVVHPAPLEDTLRRLLMLPTVAALTALENGRALSRSVAALDGLLAMLFTSPGIRSVSVHDLVQRQSQHGTAHAAGIAKVQRAIDHRLAKLMTKVGTEADLGALLLHEYADQQPSFPEFTLRRDQGMSIAMTVEPMLSYSTRRQQSDGYVSSKTNVYLRGTVPAGLLMMIGAAYGLRGQRVGGQLVNVYVPLPQHIILQADSALPILKRTDEAADAAFLLQWLTYGTQETDAGAVWKALAYQTVQTQGVQQSIAWDQGCLDYPWLHSLQLDFRQTVMARWSTLLGTAPADRHIETDALVTMLRSRQLVHLLAHLDDVVVEVGYRPDGCAMTYTLDELREVTTMMHGPDDHSLRMVLQQDTGTLRIGHALRLLGRINRGVFRDLLDALDAVRTRDNLIDVLTDIAEACSLALATTPFMIVPTTDDLDGLLADVERYGAQTIAKLIRVLSVLRYPRLEKDGDIDDSAAEEHGLSDDAPSADASFIGDRAPHE